MGALKGVMINRTNTVIIEGKGAPGILTVNSDGEVIYFRRNFANIEGLTVDAILSIDPLEDKVRAAASLNIAKQFGIVDSEVINWFNYGKDGTVLITDEECVAVSLDKGICEYVEETASYWEEDSYQYNEPLVIFVQEDGGKTAINSTPEEFMSALA